MRDIITQLIDGRDLSREQTIRAMDLIMSGSATPAQVAGFLVALRVKGETVDEITGCATVMREKASLVRTPPDVAVVDTCGTGGDHAGTFNISTAAALVAAAAGATVAKHGNRSVTSSSGSADVLKTLGVNIEAGVDVVEQCLSTSRIGFMFAPLMHGAMKYAIGPRRELGVRTVFNVLGPLTNPARAQRQVMGVFDRHLVEPLAHVLRNLGSQHALVVASADGLDEISLHGITYVAEATADGVQTYQVEAADFGLEPVELEDLRVDSADESAAVIRGVLDGRAGAARRIVLANAGAALMVSGLADGLRAGAERAAEAIDSGQARRTLHALAAASHAAPGSDRPKHAD